ncbi:MAG: hypothetical protein ACKOEL_00880 [Planctomycetota bacterium]
MKRSASRTTVNVAALVAAAHLAALAGCYRHVVKATGPGAGSYETYEANIGEDESVWSQPKPRVIERNPIPVPTAQPKQSPDD